MTVDELVRRLVVAVLAPALGEHVFGIMAPAGTGKDIVARLNRESRGIASARGG
jgi:hypothetical protein